jgi:ABC-type molybdenum transport system ATPase subunit/photorepair protein PhrA
MSTPATLKSLTLTAFRGSTATFSLDFEKGKKLTLIYGENGTGKTTICDAFEFLAFEKVGSIEDRGMGKGLEKFWPTAGKPASALQVDLETSAAKCTGTIINKKVSVAPTSARPRIELLRQRQILELIQARPGDRYERIKRFIDIEAFETSEEALRQLGKSLATEMQLAQAAEDENLAALQGFYDAAGKPAGLNPVTWAKKRLAEPETGRDADIAAIGKLRLTFETLKPYPERLASCRAAIATAKEALVAAEKALAEAIALATKGAGEALAVLEAGLDYLHAHPSAAECPLCGSDEKIAGLEESIVERLKNLAALRAADAAKKAQEGALTSAEAALTQAEADYEKALAAFTVAQTRHSWKPEVKLPSSAPPADPAELAQWLSDNADVAATWPGVEASWHDEKKFIAALKIASERYESNVARRKELAVLRPKVELALTQCVDERQKFTDGIISAIAQEVGKLYEAVHPGEGLDAIALPLDPAKRASMELMAKFAGQDAPPQAYFSQSHLDTLGLCVFLALAARDRPDETVLILDDVLGSVDEPHVERVIGMVYEVSTKFRHTLVTTHYRPWREKYRWGWLKPGQPCQFVELTNWALDDGIRLTSSLPELHRLKELLAVSPPDPQAICSKAGVILEAALDYLTLKYECAVPRRQGAAYTLGDLLPAISGKLRDALKVEIRDGITDPAALPTTTVALKPILDELGRVAQARNAMGAHFKAISFELLDNDAVAFAAEVVQLLDALTHPTDGWPSSDKSGSYWRNSADSRRLHPLKKPN